MPLTARRAFPSDADLLGFLNHQLIRDEGHRSRMTVPELQERMRRWLAGDYIAVLFDREAELIAYALYREESDLIYLRQLFVQRHRRRQGFGREALQLMRSQIWPPQKRLTVEVLVSNTAAISFYRASGFHDYSVTLEVLPA